MKSAVENSEEEGRCNILIAGQCVSEVSCVAAAPPAAVPLLSIQLLLTPLQLLRDVVPHLLHIHSTDVSRGTNSLLSDTLLGLVE